MFTLRSLATRVSSSFKSTSCTRGISTSRNVAGVYEPDDLNTDPEIPEYPELNISLKGYDFSVLECFMKYVNQTVNALDIKSTSYAVPQRTTDVKLFKPRSSLIDIEHKLIKYERVVRVRTAFSDSSSYSLQNVGSTTVPLVMEIIRSNLPEGVQMTTKEPELAEENFRYVPDVIMEVYEKQLDDLDKAKEDRRK